MMKIKRSTLIPSILAIYLAVMAYIGYDEYASGKMSALYYFGVIGITLLILVLLHFNLKRRERLQKERIEDMNNQNNPQ
ncbi:MAG: hypothetical protein NC548_53615 [Lachnospiraceae bacterium]|nr:hypothetical protein [Lachnospiraceae bacterium]